MPFLPRSHCHAQVVAGDISASAHKATNGLTRTCADKVTRGTGRAVMPPERECWPVCYAAGPGIASTAICRAGRACGVTLGRSAEVGQGGGTELRGYQGKAWGLGWEPAGGPKLLGVYRSTSLAPGEGQFPLRAMRICWPPLGKLLAETIDSLIQCSLAFCVIIPMNL